MRALALVDSQGQGWDLSTQDPVHEVVEMPLNHLGVTVRRHDIRRGPPPAAYLQNLRAVITFFQDAGNAPPWLWPWLEERARDPRLRFLHLGNCGPLIRTPEGRKDVTRFAKWLRRFGLGYDDFYGPGPLGIRVSYLDKTLCALESDGRRWAVHRGPWNLDDSNVPWVTTRHAAEPYRARTPVVTGSWGGIALNPWVYRGGSGMGDRRWHLDPFAFFRQALGLEGIPAPHPSVLNGRRMFFCHVDGDGFESISTVRRGLNCGRVFLEDVVDRYHLPFTVSVIIGSLTDDFATTEVTEKMRVASELLCRSNVEPATHTVTHPFFWNGVPKSMVADDPPLSGFPDLRNFKSDPRAEVAESIRFIDERLLRDGRRCRLVLWSGDTCPGRGAILEAGRRGGLNLNGGTFRWDAQADSVAYVSPWGRRVGDAIQVYAGAANENTFDGFYTTMPSAFRHINETIVRTGRGRILKPANVYIHFYSVERPARLRVLHRLIRRWAIEEETAPVFASVYAAAVNSALTTARIHRMANGWRFTGFGHCRTVRIDDEAREVDWDRSFGLLGSRRIGPSLYLHLAAPVVEVVLSRTAEDRPHVEEANHALTDVSMNPEGVSLTSKAIFRREITLAGFPTGIDVDVVVDGKRSQRRTDAEGRIGFEFEGPGRTRLEVRIP
jgi:polysaccharide biosynthesis protein PelA